MPSLPNVFVYKGAGNGEMIKSTLKVGFYHISGASLIASFAHFFILAFYHLRKDGSTIVHLCQEKKSLCCIGGIYESKL